MRSWDTAFKGDAGKKTSDHEQHKSQGANQSYDQQHAADAGRRGSEEAARRRVAEEARRKAEQNARRQAEQEERSRTEEDVSHTAKNSGKSSYAVLGIRPEASPEEITTAYHQKARQYHPDRVEGLGPEFKELADQRMKEINAAYEELKS